MTMFYERRELRFLDEKRAREIAVEEMNKRFGEPADLLPFGHIRTIDGDVVSADDAMRGAPKC